MDLKSGAKLEVTLADFEKSRALYQAMLEEIKDLKVNFDDQIDVNFFKNVFCAGFSSKKIETCIWACMTRATYNGVKITKDTFEPEEARGDYFDIQFEVAKANILPFTKNLYAVFSQIKDLLGKSPA